MVKQEHWKELAKQLGLEEEADDVEELITYLADIPTDEPNKYRDSFVVFLDGFRVSNKLNVIKTIREINCYKMGLKKAKEFVENCPNRVATLTLRSDAEKMKKQLEDSGGFSSIKEYLNDKRIYGTMASS